MSSCTNKNYNFPHKNWLLLLNVHEKQRKKASSPTYSNLYAYAGNNPVHYLDPDGRIIEIDDSDPKFKDQVLQSIEYLKQSETGKNIIVQLENSETVFTIKKSMWLNNNTDAEGGNSFDRLTNTIYWNGEWTIIASNGNYNSPAICLMHELVHAWGYKTEYGNKVFQNFCSTNAKQLTNPQYDTPEEEFATAIEQIVANQLGECAGRSFYNDLQWLPNNSLNPTCFYSIHIQVLSPLSHSGR